MHRINSTRGFFTVIMAILTNFACDHSENTFQPALDVHSVLRNDMSWQELALSRTYDMDESESFDLEEALVIISGDSTTDTMIFNGQNPFYHGGEFIAWPFALQPRMTYRLLIHSEGYDTLYGQTTVPGDFDVLLPDLDDTININDTLVFSASKGAREYQIAAIDDWGSYNYWIIWPSTEPESLFIMPLAIFSDWMDEGEYIIKVFACDSNFFNYEYHYSDDPPQCGVEGGIGLFGSMWVESTKVYLKVN